MHSDRLPTLAISNLCTSDLGLSCRSEAEISVGAEVGRRQIAVDTLAYESA